MLFRSPVNELTTIGSEVQLVNVFGAPDQNTFPTFFTAASFLAYTQNLLVVRAAVQTDTGGTNYNASSGNSPLFIPNKNSYELNYMPMGTLSQASANNGMFTARYPSYLGNGLAVSIWANTTNTAAWSNTWALTGNTQNSINWSAYFNGIPGTSPWVQSQGGQNDEMHIIVIDTLGNFTSTPNTVLERYAYVSKAIDATNDDGTSNYYVNVINEKSNYIYITHHPVYQPANTNTWVSDTTNWGAISVNTNFSEISFTKLYR